jgi:hypothetical protein
VCSRGTTNKRVVIFVASYDAWSYCALVAPCLCCADAESGAHSVVGTAPGGDADSLEILKMIEQRHRGRQAAQAATTGDSDPVHALAPINLQHVPLLGYLRATHVFSLSTTSVLRYNIGDGVLLLLLSGFLL